MTKQQSLVNRKTNRLVNETSPYLQQHAYNPVDWWSWCPEALEQARKQDKPILLSIGYAACHWCHVMAHESFEDPATADLMNRHFINIKVDREERPDLDEIYMRAVQAINGHGGWPMTVFLTSELKPFFSGTYFPPVDRYNMPSFQTVLNTVAKAWSQQREQIEQSSVQLTDFLSAIDLQAQSGAEQAVSALAITQIIEAIKRILGIFDRQYGGLGGAPKFPHPYATELVMRAYVNPQTEGALKRACYEFIETTLNRMACGGIHDQLGGGFARYSVDSQWLIPHFEKMLYDNAALIKNYLSGYQIFKNEYWKDVAIDCLGFVERVLMATEGGFYSSLDADSEGSEGKFYVWTAAEVIDVLGKENGQWFSTVYGISPEGNFEHGSSVLNFAEPPEVLAQELGISLTEFWAKLNPLRQKLLEVRSKRTAPGTDEKVITSWNALIISTYVKAFQVLGDAKYLQIAVNAMQFILKNMYQGSHKDSRLLRTWAKGKAHLNGYLEDYVFVVQALLDLASVDASSTWLSAASELNEIILSRFFDQDSSSFFYTSDNHEKLILRTKNNLDGPLPSSTSVAIMNLLRLARITDNSKFEVIAKNVLKQCASQFEHAVDQYSNMLCALDLFLADKLELVIVTSPGLQDTNHMLSAANSIYLPNLITVATDGSSDYANASALLANRTLKGNKVTAYLCRNFSCQEPVNAPAVLSAQLSDVETE
jgi:hypothetical protein